MAECRDAMSNTSETTEYGEPIDLRWSQRLAAFWSILWPGILLNLLLVSVIGGTLGRPAPAAAVGIFSPLIQLVGQYILSVRLVRKNYRTFWIGVVRRGGPPQRSLGFREQIRVWLQVIWPQIAFLVVTSLSLLWVKNRISAETTSSLQSFLNFMYYLAIGPAAIGWAVDASYPGFYLQAYRPKRKIQMSGNPDDSNPDEH